MSVEQIGGRVVASVGNAVAAQVVEAVAEMVRHPDKYSGDSLQRFNVLKAIYASHYPDAKDFPGIWTLDPDHNTPSQEFPGGTWEQYWESKLRKEATSLRGDVEDLLSVISRFLDQRRENLGVTWGIYKGDVEEKFFSEILGWVIRHIDCDVNDSLAKPIEKRMDYLRAVMNATDEIFPKRSLPSRIHDRSAAFGVTREINEMLLVIKQKAKTIHDGKFLLDKFGHISKLGALLLKHFSDSFSYFSSTLRALNQLNHETVTSAIKGSGTGYEALFCLFLNKVLIDASGKISVKLEGDNHQHLFSLEWAEKFISGKKFAIGVPMLDEMQKLIPDIFSAAYNFSVAMSFIGHASSTLSEQGTTNLFCNKEGRLCYNFLILDVESEAKLLLSRLSDFSDRAQKYADDTYLRTGQKFSKHELLGQYPRFQRQIKRIKNNHAQLLECLKETSKKIESFKEIEPEGSLDRKKQLYDSVKKRMRAKGQHDLVKELDNITASYSSSQELPSVPPGENKESVMHDGDVTSTGISHAGLAELVRFQDMNKELAGLQGVQDILTMQLKGKIEDYAYQQELMQQLKACKAEIKGLTHKMTGRPVGPEEDVDMLDDSADDSASVNPAAVVGVVSEETEVGRGGVIEEVDRIEIVVARNVDLDALPVLSKQDRDANTVNVSQISEINGAEVVRMRQSLQRGRGQTGVVGAQAPLLAPQDRRQDAEYGGGVEEVKAREIQISPVPRDERGEQRAGNHELVAAAAVRENRAAIVALERQLKERIKLCEDQMIEYCAPAFLRKAFRANEKVQLGNDLLGTCRRTPLSHIRTELQRIIQSAKDQKFVDDLFYTEADTLLAECAKAVYSPLWEEVNKGVVLETALEEKIIALREQDAVLNQKEVEIRRLNQKCEGLETRLSNLTHEYESQRGRLTHLERAAIVSNGERRQLQADNVQEKAKTLLLQQKLDAMVQHVNALGVEMREERAETRAAMEEMRDLLRSQQQQRASINRF